MTDEQARATANVVLVAAGAAAVYFVLKTPPLRRLAWRATEVWLGASIPMYLVKQVRRAWVQSAPA